MPVTQNAGGRRGLALQRVGGLAGLALLPGADGDVDGNGRPDNGHVKG